ncbi:MAG: hypothetical protein WD795_16430 [Woeseia sp.]
MSAPTIDEIELLRRRYGDDAVQQAYLLYIEDAVQKGKASAKPLSHWIMTVRRCRSNAARADAARKRREARYARQQYPEMADAKKKVTAQFFS